VWISELLKEHRWDCPEALEPNRWVRIVHTITPWSNLSWACFHSWTYFVILYFIVDGWVLSRLRQWCSLRQNINALQDDRQAVQLSEIRKEILNQSKALAITKASLQKRVADEIRVLSDWRAELKGMEERSKVAMSKEDDKIQSLIGDLLMSAGNGSRDIYNLRARLFGEETSQNLPSNRLSYCSAPSSSLSSIKAERRKTLNIKPGYSSQQ